MADGYPLGSLEDSWLTLLVEQGHDPLAQPLQLGVMHFRNGKGKTFRWLLILSSEAVRVLSTEEKALIRWHVSQARKIGERAFLVVGFLSEPKRIVVMLASRALRAAGIWKDRGGIAWED